MTEFSTRTNSKGVSKFSAIWFSSKKTHYSYEQSRAKSRYEECIHVLAAKSKYQNGEIEMK